MIIIGTTELTLGRQRGVFYCPGCRRQTTYRHRIRRAFVTLYFIPVIPLGKTAEFILCESCKEPYEHWVAEQPPEQVEAQCRNAALLHIFRVMLLTMLADDVASDEEVRVMRAFLESIGAPEPTNEQIERQIEFLQASELTAAHYAGQVADELTWEEREQMVAGAFLVASASGPLSETQLADLRLLPLALDIDEDRFRQIIAEASERLEV